MTTLPLPVDAATTADDAAEGVTWFTQCAALDPLRTLVL